MPQRKSAKKRAKNDTRRETSDMEKDTFLVRGARAKLRTHKTLRFLGLRRNVATLLTLTWPTLQHIKRERRERKREKEREGERRREKERE